MRASKDQAAESRRRIVETASRLFRERGVEGVGVATLMQAAGLTHGGFYGHFPSKEQLAAEACCAAFAESERHWRRMFERAPASARQALVERYLSPAHRDAPGKGCALPALASDAARQGTALRQAFGDGLLRLVAALAPHEDGTDGRGAALATLSTLVGALSLARAVDDPALSEEILAAARVQLLSAAPAAGEHADD